jgi:Zn-dependent M16 (insulinase) family peptidase
MFSIGLKGIDPADADKVERLIADTIGGLADRGIDPLTVEAAVNTVEFALRENNTGAFPRGIVFMLRALRSWLHGRDPLTPLAFDARVFFYGDDDPEERLRLLDKYLGEFDRIAVDARVPLQQRFRAPKRLTRTYASGASEDAAQGEADKPKESMISVNWMIDEIVDVETALGFDILEHLEG